MFLEDGNSRKIIKETQFFQPLTYLGFKEDVKRMRIKVNPQYVSEIALRCCAYGYFEQNQESRQFQTKLRTNFQEYLKEAVECCPNLRCLKIQLNGFILQVTTINTLVAITKELLNRRDLRQGNDLLKAKYDSVQIHCRMMRNCSIQSVYQLLQLASNCINHPFGVSEISISMSGWQFNRSISYQQFKDILKKFQDSLRIPKQSAHRRLKLNFSSWYSHSSQAYSFLADSVKTSDLKESIKDSRHNEDANRSHIPQKQMERLKNVIDAYLKSIDNRFLIQNPISSSPQFIVSKELQFKKLKHQYIQEQLTQGSHSCELLKVLSGKGLNEQHTKALKDIQAQINQRVKVQMAREERDQQLVKEVDKHEKEISQHYIKFPFDHIMAMRVRQFHLMMTLFIRSIQATLASLQEVEIDLRDWSSLFQLGQLKKSLNKQFAQEGTVKLIGSGYGRNLQKQCQVGNEGSPANNRVRLTFLT